MKPIQLILLSGLLFVGCDRQAKKPDSSDDPIDLGADAKLSLPEARKDFKTKALAPKRSVEKTVPQPPPKLFSLVRYDAPLGKNAAYLTPDPKDGKKHPAIIWITGGDCNSIDEGTWTQGKPDNEQSASAYRQAGIIMMFPALRGGQGSSGGMKEGFFGEVDDVLAATDYLSKQEYVDPKRIYLGGHSTGGTLVFLVAECSNRFRAVFSFGPVDDVKGYEAQYRPFDASNQREFELRAPIRWLHSIQSPLFVVEGIQGNLSSLQKLGQASRNPLAHFLPVKGASHFSVLGPTNRLIASKILLDTGPTCNITLSEEELNKLFGK